MMTVGVSGVNESFRSLSITWESRGQKWVIVLMNERRVELGGRDGERNECKRSHTEKNGREDREREMEGKQNIKALACHKICVR